MHIRQWVETLWRTNIENRQLDCGGFNNVGGPEPVSGGRA
jgi:hypothetical protein